MNSPIDNHFIQSLETKLEKTTIKRVDADVIDKLIVKEDTLNHSLTEDETKKLKEIFEKAINNTNMQVEVEALHNEALPVTITMEEWMRRMKDMARMGGGGMNFYGSLPDTYKVSVNGNHKLVEKILKADNEEEQNQLAKQAFDLGLLSQGMLKGADLTAFVERSVQLI
jgi:molecular chaperone HtpG